MHLSEIRLQNYKSFRDAAITFQSPTEKKSLIVITGNNGVGKTSISRAIQWTLYGEKHESAFVARSVFAKEDQPTQVSLKLVDNGSTVQIKRSLLPFKRDDPHHPTSSLEVFIDSEEITSPKRYVSRKMPESIAPLYFIDGDVLSRPLSLITDIKSRLIDGSSSIDLTEKVIVRLAQTTKHFEISGAHLTSMKGFSRLGRESLGHIKMLLDRIKNEVPSGSLKMGPPGFEINVEIEKLLYSDEVDLYQGTIGMNIETFSAGELVAFSLRYLFFQAAKHGNVFPIVLDTPFAQLSPHAISNTLNYLSQLMTGQQTILLLLPNEFDRVKKLLAPHIQDEYHLEKEQESRETVAISR